MLWLLIPKPDNNFLSQVPASFSLFTEDIPLKQKQYPVLVQSYPEVLEI